jgi:4-hydroxy-tetrahydrodipicolinate synthase
MNSIDPKLRQALTGISGILVTPFDDQDEVAPHHLSGVIDRAIRAGVHVLVSNGNTGEFYSLTTAEAERMIHATAELVRGRVPLLGGVGRGIKDACALARAWAAGASALMVHQPPDPFVAPRSVIDYVTRVAAAGEGLPLMLYLRNDAIGLEAIEQLCAYRVSPASNGLRRRRFGLRRRYGEPIRRSSGSADWPRPGRRRSMPWAREALPRV